MDRNLYRSNDQDNLARFCIWFADARRTIKYSSLAVVYMLKWPYCVIAYDNFYVCVPDDVSVERSGSNAGVDVRADVWPILQPSGRSGQSQQQVRHWPVPENRSRYGRHKYDLLPVERVDGAGHDLPWSQRQHGVRDGPGAALLRHGSDLPRREWLPLSHQPAQRGQHHQHGQPNLHRQLGQPQRKFIYAQSYTKWIKKQSTLLPNGNSS